jgi:hypothetical protein
MREIWGKKKMLPEELSLIVSEFVGCNFFQKLGLVEILSDAIPSKKNLIGPSFLCIDELDSVTDKILGGAKHLMIIDRDKNQIEKNLRTFVPKTYKAPDILVRFLARNHDVDIMYDSFHRMLMTYKTDFQCETKEEFEASRIYIKELSKIFWINFKNRLYINNNNRYALILERLSVGSFRVTKSKYIRTCFNTSGRKERRKPYPIGPKLNSLKKFTRFNTFSEITGKEYKVDDMTRTNICLSEKNKIWNDQIRQTKKKLPKFGLIKLRNNPKEVECQNLPYEIRDRPEPKKVRKLFVKKNFHLPILRYEEWKWVYNGTAIQVDTEKVIRDFMEIFFLRFFGDPKIQL